MEKNNIDVHPPTSSKHPQIPVLQSRVPGLTLIICLLCTSTTFVVVTITFAWPCVIATPGGCVEAWGCTTTDVGWAVIICGGWGTVCWIMVVPRCMVWYGGGCCVHERHEKIGKKSKTKLINNLTCTFRNGLKLTSRQNLENALMLKLLQSV